MAMNVPKNCLATASARTVRVAMVWSMILLECNRFVLKIINPDINGQYIY